MTSGHPDVTAGLDEMPPGNWLTCAAQHACMAAGHACFSIMLYQSPVVGEREAV